MLRIGALVVVVLALAAVARWHGDFGALARPSQPLAQSAYIWERAWNADVTASITASRAQFSLYVPLAAEISAAPGGEYRAAFTGVDYPLIATAAHAATVAVRLGPASVGKQKGAFAELRDVVEGVLQRAAHQGVAVTEVHLDFDAATSQLGAYAAAVRRLIAEHPAVRFTPTVLPTWLGTEAFKELAATAGQFILQVHSLHPPHDDTSAFAILDPREAAAAIRAAGATGVPFQVALPTYSYQAAFGPHGAFLGLAADGQRRAWPAATALRSVRSDPAAVAALVAALAGPGASPPRNLRGLIWYRLPVAGQDAWNWSIATLATVQRGQAPRGVATVTVDQSAAPLYRVVLHSSGDDEVQTAGLSVVVGWTGAKLVAADALGTFSFSRQAPQAQGEAASFRGRELGQPGLAPGQAQTIGWVRLDHPGAMSTRINGMAGEGNGMREVAPDGQAHH